MVQYFGSDRIINMEEKILIKSKKHNTKKIILTFTLIGILIVVLVISSIFVSNLVDNNIHKHSSTCIDMGEYRIWYDIWNSQYMLEENGVAVNEVPRKTDIEVIKTIPDPHAISTFYEFADCELYKETALSCTLSETFSFDNMSVAFGVIVGFAFVGVVLAIIFASYELVVTDKRIHGEVKGIGKNIDLPWNAVSAVKYVSLFNLISVSTNSGRISFFYIGNSKEIYEVILSEVISRQV